MERKNQIDEVTKNLSERLFHEDRMYQELKKYAGQNGLLQTDKMIDYVCKQHEGQFRKGKDKVPYVYHPLSLACHAIALGLGEDDFLSVALLHDVCEDCDIPAEKLPVNERTKTAVSLLTKDKTAIKASEDGLAKYYEKLAENKIALMIKCLDRCHNVSHMAAAFSMEKMASYVTETKEYIYPLLDLAEQSYPEYKNQVYLIRYHLLSVVSTICQMIGKVKN